MQSTEKKHHHAEAFMHMTYFGQSPAGRIELKIWNSRDGVTPFMVTSNEYGITLQSVSWGHAKYDPSHKPKKGELIWVSHTEETARQVAEQALAGFEKMAAMTDEEIEALNMSFNPRAYAKLQIADREAYIKKFIHECLHEHGEPAPHLLLVTEDWQ